MSFSDAIEGAKALREMNGKYVGNRPCKLSKSTWDVSLHPPPLPPRLSPKNLCWISGLNLFQGLAGAVSQGNKKGCESVRLLSREL